MLLTASELEDLTRRKRAAAQCRALDAMGIAYLRDVDGHPRVLRSLVERMLGADERRAMLNDPEPELCLEPPPSKRPPSATVRVFQARRILAGQKG